MHFAPLKILIILLMIYARIFSVSVPLRFQRDTTLHVSDGILQPTNGWVQVGSINTLKNFDVFKEADQKFRPQGLTVLVQLSTRVRGGP